MKSIRDFYWKKAEISKSVSRIKQILLSEKGLNTPEKIQDFFSFSYKKLLDPFLINSMDRACNRIWKAIKSNERIMVFGDFDADGVSSTVILVSVLKSLGAQISYRIPDRANDGHGVKDYLVDEIAEKNVSLIITCDCGINDKSAISHAKKLGIDIIVTDHHEPDETRFPDQAEAVINPKLSPCFPEKNLSGSAVVFKLVQGLISSKKWENKKSQEKFLNRYAEIAAIGIIADCVPLVGENRCLVQLGLAAMKNTSWEGLVLLLEQNSISPESLDEGTIGFVIAPRINAASRMGDVRVAVQLFLGKKEYHSSQIKNLEQMNQLRKELTKEGIQEARKQVVPGASCQIFFDPDWKQGVLGLIASRYVEELQVPIIVCTQKKDGKISASCRSPKGICMVTALLKSQDFLTFFGGHAGAAGFATEKRNFHLLKKLLISHFQEQKKQEILVDISVFTDICFLKGEMDDFLKTLSPFGVGNNKPRFGISNFLVKEVLPLGKSGEHFKIKGESEEMVLFFANEYISQIIPGKSYDLVCEFQKKIWRNKVQFEYKLIDARQSE